MPALTQPTGAQIMAIIPVEPGGDPLLGALTAEQIDNYITAQPITNEVVLAFNYISKLVADHGLDPASLNVVDYGQLQAAVLFITAYEMLRLDWVKAIVQSDKAINRAYGDRLGWLRSKGAAILLSFDIYSKYHSDTRPSLTLIC